MFFSTLWFSCFMALLIYSSFPSASKDLKDFAIMFWEIGMKIHSAMNGEPLVRSPNEVQQIFPIAFIIPVLSIYFFLVCTWQVNHRATQANLGKSRRKKYIAYGYKNIKTCRMCSRHFATVLSRENHDIQEHRFPASKRGKGDDWLCPSVDVHTT